MSLIKPERTCSRTEIINEFVCLSMCRWTLSSNERRFAAVSLCQVALVSYMAYVTTLYLQGLTCEW